MREPASQKQLTIHTHTDTHTHLHANTNTHMDKHVKFTSHEWDVDHFTLDAYLLIYSALTAMYNCDVRDVVPRYVFV